MNIVSKTACRTMLKSRTRTVVTVLGIILSAAMFTAVLTLGFSVWDFLVRGAIYNNGDYFIQYDYLTDETVTELSESPNVLHGADLQILGTWSLSQGRDGSYLIAAADPCFLETMPLRLLEGRAPQNSTELVIPKSSRRLMENCGYETQLGSTVTFRMDRTSLSGQELPPVVGTYTIVGYIEGYRYGDFEMDLQHMITAEDQNSGKALWHRLFLKPQTKHILSFYEQKDGYQKTLNQTLSGLYGVSAYGNYNRTLVALVMVLCAIIMVGSVSLIHNAFSISVSERTKQFGLLRSIGATKKQIRGAVYTEALIVSAVGIPVGILAGFVGIAVTLNLLSTRIDHIISLGGGAVKLRPVICVPGLVLAALIALVTVFISVAIPAARATGISPMEAIRQQKEYRRPRKQKKLGKLTKKIFGLPGALGQKYYTVTRNKYITTIISLVVSFVLFVSASCLSQSMGNLSRNTFIVQNYDMVIRADPEDLENLRQQPFVEKAAYQLQDHFYALTPDDQLSNEFLGHWEALEQYYLNSSRNLVSTYIYYLEDEVLKEYLSEQGLPAEPYFDKTCPKALVCSKDFTTYGYQDGEMIRYDYDFDQFSETADHLQLFRWDVPGELLNLPELEDYSMDQGVAAYVADEAGNLKLELRNTPDPTQIIPDHSFDIRLDTTQPGKCKASFYNSENDLVTTAVYDVPAFQLGAYIKELPFGISTGATQSYYYTAVILPLSHAPKDAQLEQLLTINVSDYPTAVGYLTRHFEPQDYQDIRSAEENSRTYMLMINVFSYGFIVLISLICIANVFNTISTNVALRKRDFGILRSIGFAPKDLMAMMRYECAIYGIRALLISIPISLCSSYLIWNIDRQTHTTTFTPPWLAMLIGALSIFAVVFAAMTYSVSKLKKDDPIDAVRME